MGPTALNHSELFIQDARQDTQAIGRQCPPPTGTTSQTQDECPSCSCAPIPTGQAVPEL